MMGMFFETQCSGVIVIFTCT